MGHDWIIDVLADMKRFARQNDMPRLSARLDDAMTAAAVEVAELQGQTGTRHADITAAQPLPPGD